MIKEATVRHIICKCFEPWFGSTIEACSKKEWALSGIGTFMKLKIIAFKDSGKTYF